MNVLYVTANPKPEEMSYSLQVGRAVIEAIQAADPNAKIVELDLYKNAPQEIDGDVLAAWGALQNGTAFTDLTPVQQQKVGTMSGMLEQFLAADRIVFATPMWNFGFPPRFKAFIDSIVAAGRTFKYTENGPVGLVTGKKAIHVHAAGGYHSEGPFKFSAEHLKGVLGFIGVIDYETVWVEGVAAVGPEQAEEIKDQAIAKAKSLVSDFLKESVVA